MDLRYPAKRTIQIRDTNYYNANAFSGFLFFSTTAYYVRSVFLKNRSIPKLVLFTGASYLMAQEWSKFFFLPVIQEAAMINNTKEKGNLISTI